MQQYEVKIFSAIIILFTALATAKATDNKWASGELWISPDDNKIIAKDTAEKTIKIGAKTIPVLIFSGEKHESITLKLPAIPANCLGIRIEAVVTQLDDNSNDKLEDAYQAQACQITPEKKEINKITFPAAWTLLSKKAFESRTIELDSCYQADKSLPIVLKISRLACDPADTFEKQTALIGIKITPVEAKPIPSVVEGSAHYNSWPMIQALGDKLICVYSRGTKHRIDEGVRGAYARTSTDGGKTWSEEVTVCNDPQCGEVPIGKGLDESGHAIFWIRKQGRVRTHDLYRTKDGVNFEKIASLSPDPMPLQITDVFHVPNVGLMSIWFRGSKVKPGLNAWGYFASKDNGKTWAQTVVEERLSPFDWNTEQSAVYLGDGKILAIGRVESSPYTAKAQYQLLSRDYGKTWTRTLTNITDVAESTPSLIFDKKTGLVYNYYYQRFRGMLKRRIVEADKILDNPKAWPKPEIVAFASPNGCDAGNVNATVQNGKHYLAYYSGDEKNTSVVVSESEPLKR